MCLNRNVIIPYSPKVTIRTATYSSHKYFLFHMILRITAGISYTVLTDWAYFDRKLIFGELIKHLKKLMRIDVNVVCYGNYPFVVLNYIH